ncbi:MAG: ABC transporter permease [Candidatus Acidiferrales bacterium]
MNALQDTRFALRMLRKSPGFTAVAVLTLALGIGANTAIFSVVDALLLLPLPYSHPSRLVELSESNEALSVPPGDFLDWQKQARSFQEMAATADMWHQRILTGAGAPDQVLTAQASSNFFKVLGNHAALGQTFLPDEPQGVVLSNYYWRAHFSANPSVIGQAINLDGKPYTIIGVMPPDFYFIGTPADVWLPLTFTALDGANHANPSLEVIARLGPGVRQGQAEAEMHVLEMRITEPGKTAGQRHVSVAPLRLPPQGDLQTEILALFGAVVFALLIACANVASMFLARGASRRREFAVRAALGASRARLARQVLTESATVSVLGGIAGLAFAYWGMQIIWGLIPSSPFLAGGSPNTPINFSVLGFTLGLCLVTAALVALMPALKSAKLDPGVALRDGGRGAGVLSGMFRAQSVLAILEIGLSLVLVTGAGLMIESFHSLMNVDTGFSPSHVLTARIPSVNLKHPPGAPIADFYTQALQRIRTIPGVKYAAITNNFPLSDAEITLTIDGAKDASGMSSQQVKTELKDITPGYFRAMGIPLLAGRSFTALDTAASAGVAIISRNLARRYWPGGDAVGKRLYGKVVIVGVVGDTVQSSLRSEPMPTVYRPYAQQPLWAFMATLVIRAKGDPLDLVQAIRSAVWEIDGDQPIIEFRTMNDVMKESVWQPRFSASILGVLSLMAVLLSAVGVYGVLAYSVSQRTREIGIRMALGAQPRDVLRMVIGHGMALAAAGILLGLGGALALTRFLRSLLFEIKPTDPATFVVVALLLALVALVACYIPARRAMRVDPLVALRYE